MKADAQETNLGPLEIHSLLLNLPEIRSGEIIHLSQKLPEINSKGVCLGELNYSTDQGS
jgi:hypothetical protein